MHVLLTNFDLFKEVGGGQTFYRNVILRNPEIQFTYLLDSEPAESPRPANATGTRCPNRFAVLPGSARLDLEVPRWLYGTFVRANDIARAMTNRHFDVVDVPDYEQYGFFLRDAFNHYGVSVDRVALGMHGRISTSLELNWCVQSRDCIEVTQLENMQYQAVDVRYFISAMYRDEWRDVDPLPSTLLDPLWYLDVPSLQVYQDRIGLPDLNFVGRCEKRKGPDIFINLAWHLPRSCYRSASLIGPPAHDRDGTSSDRHLRQMISNRRLTGVELVRCLTPSELALVFSSKSVTIVPSVYDTLNFVALESLFSGCPTVIGSGAGVCRYLCERFPRLPFEVINIDNWYECVPRLKAILRNYRDYRQRLQEAVAAEDLQPHGLKLTDVYQARPAYDPVLRARVTDWYERLSRCAGISRRRVKMRAICA